MLKFFAIIFEILLCQFVSLTVIGCQSVDIALKKRQIKVEFLLSLYWEFYLGIDIIIIKEFW